MQGQLDEARDARRPWVVVNKTISRAVPYRDQIGGFHFPRIGYKLSNTGNTPAVNVTVDIHSVLILETDPPEIVREIQKRLCDAPIQSLHEVVVFPGQDVHVGQELVLTKQKIDEAAVRNGGDLPGYYMWGIGCIRYRSLNGTLHQTGQIFSVHEHGGGRYIQIDPTKALAGSIYLQPWINGETNYAY